MIDRDGIIVTNNHVVEGATGITSSFNDGRHTQPLAGEVIGTAPGARPRGHPRQPRRPRPVALGRSSALRLGDAVIAIGFPLGLGGADRDPGDRLRARPHDRARTGRRSTGLLQTDAAINPGNSGGAARRPRRAGWSGSTRPAVRRRHGRERRLRDRDRRGAAGDRRDPQRAAATRAWLGIAFASVDSDSAAVQLGLDASTRGAARDGGLSGRARPPRRTWPRRRDHRRRRRADPDRARASRSCSPRAIPATSSSSR